MVLCGRKGVLDEGHLFLGLFLSPGPGRFLFPPIRKLHTKLKSPIIYDTVDS